MLRSPIFALCLVLAILNASAEEMFAPIYVVKGILKYQDVFTNNESGRIQSWYFTVMADKGGKWNIRAETTFPNEKLPIKSTTVTAYNGRDIYSVLYSHNKLVTTPDGDVKMVSSDSNDSSPAIITSGTIPLDQSSSIGLIWFTFLGADFVSKSKIPTNYPNVLVSNARTDPAAWSCDLDCQMIGSHSNLLISNAKYILNKSRLSSYSIDYLQLDEPGNEDELEKFWNKVKLYEDACKDGSFVCATYALDSKTNLNGIFIPTVSHCDLTPLPNMPFLKKGLFNIVVTNVSFPQELYPLLPEINSSVWVEDKRFVSKNYGYWRQYLLYTLTRSDEWTIETNSARLQNELSKNSMQPRFSLYSSGIPSDVPYKHRIVLLCLFILPSVLFFAYWTRKKYTGRRI